MLLTQNLSIIVRYCADWQFICLLQLLAPERFIGGGDVLPQYWLKAARVPTHCYCIWRLCRH